MEESEYELKWREQHEHLIARLADIERYAMGDADRMAASEMRTMLGHYDRGFTRVTDMIHRGDLTNPEACNLEIGTYKDEIHRLETLVADPATQHYVAAESASATVASQSRQARAMMGGQLRRCRW